MRLVYAHDDGRALVWPPKDANEVSDYSISFKRRLGSTSLSAAVFSLATAAGLTIDSSEDDDSDIATVKLSGGTEGQVGKILCRITNSDGETLDQTIKLPIRAR